MVGKKDLYRKTKIRLTFFPDRFESNRGGTLLGRIGERISVFVENFIFYRISIFRVALV